MKEFLDACDLTKLNQEEANNFSRSIISGETEAVIKTLPTRARCG